MVGTQEGSSGGARCGQMCREVPVWQLQGRVCAGLSQESDLCSLSGSRVPCPHLPSHLLSAASFPDPLRILPPELRSLGHALLSASPLHCHVTHSLWLPLLPNPRPYRAYFMDKCVLCGCLS